MVYYSSCFRRKKKDAAPPEDYRPSCRFLHRSYLLVRRCVPVSVGGMQYMPGASP
jgi:hypothetical protein